MSATLSERPASPAPPVRSARVPATPPAAGRREEVVVVATLALLTAACVPLARTYVGLGFVRPVFGALLLAIGMSWGARRLGAGPLTGLVASALGWVTFCSAAFFADTLAFGLLPTPATADAAVALWVRGLELIQVRPAPAFAEAGLVFITVTGVWAVVHAVEGLVFRLHAPVAAIAMALVLWVVPLALAPPTTAWPWAVPFLAASALLLLAFAGADVSGWAGARRAPDGRGVDASLLPTGTVIAVVAIVAGTVLAGVLPGFGQNPWYELRGLGGTTLTTNPIVDIRTRLVARDNGPVMRVEAQRPVYLRTTSLDVYSENEEWTNAGITGGPIEGTVPFEVDLGPVEQVAVDVSVENLPQAVLVPAPYQALEVAGPAADAFQYDRSTSTLTLDRGTTLEAGDSYRVVAAIPAPSPEQLDGVASFAPDGALTQLPGNVSPRVAQLARDIVARAGADTPFRQALAVQNELRSWRYSTDPPQGHGSQAMDRFIDAKVGYCEQFAGTMAVMLRTLDIPARVAVGYTPGERIEGNQYVITNGNAHAWVEVLFPGIGWVAFEPTPREDGNVLVPTAANLAPSQTLAQRVGDGVIDPEVPGLGDLVPTPRTDRDAADAAIAPEPSQDEPGAGGAGGGGRDPLLVVLLGLVGVAVLAGGLVAVRSGADRQTAAPRERVLRSRRDVERVGRGLGLSPTAWETDLEYLQRLAHRHGDPALAPARTLAGHVAGARYASTLPPAAATESEAAAGALRARLLQPLSPWRRAVVRARGPIALALGDLRRRLGRR